ncbi:heme iron utilization protein [Azospirillum doebereinerae]|uniref:Heme iron utilization protein n=1 Tax=Azospirillum doebereinerae TaxID=92933 RepID=A0A433JBV3_9PROT|nr:heme iron utilization protein [Azospirillum doebereinerae]
MSATEALGASSPRGTDGPSPLPATPDAAGQARRLMRGYDRATLATAQAEPKDAAPDDAGWPYPSLVLVASDHDGSPLLLLSTLAEHTRNLARDPRVGLLFDGTGGLAQPLTGARLSVLGRAARSDEPRHRARFLRRHPDAAFYAGFADFAVYRVAVERAHLVAGFGRIHWLSKDALGLPGVPSALAEAESDTLAALNAAHAAALPLLVPLPPGSAERGEGWTLTGLDPEGCDLRCGGYVARVDFDERTNHPESARLALAALVQRAARPGGTGGPR